MNFKNILVIQTAFLGDVILSTPVAKALKQIFPDSKIDVLTIPTTQVVFKYNPYVNQIITFDKKRWGKKLISFFKLVQLFRKRRYDLAVSLQSSLTSAMLMLLGRIPIRVGFDFQRFVTIPIPFHRELHTRERYLCLLKPFSGLNFDSQTELFWSDKEELKVQSAFDSIVNKGRNSIGIAPGSVWRTKMWPKAYYISLLQMLSREDVNIFLIGGKTERALCNEIIEKSPVQALNLAGKLTELESAALIRQMDLMVTNDSAPLHIANAVKTDVVAIFGPTVREFGFYPFRERDQMVEIELYCRPCSKHGGRRCPEKHFRCMLEITPERVFQVIMSMMNSPQIEETH